MVGLGDLPGCVRQSLANDVNADGTVVVGRGRGTFNIIEATYWTSSGGMQRLWDVLLAAGVDPALSGWTVLTEAHGVSFDGFTVAGYGPATATSKPSSPSCRSGR